MKYRIKITTFESGRKEFCAYVKKGLFWSGLWCGGEDTVFGPYIFNNRESALGVIDEHYSGNKKRQNIEFEYINK